MFSQHLLTVEPPLEIKSSVKYQNHLFDLFSISTGETGQFNKKHLESESTIWIITPQFLGK